MTELSTLTDTELTTRLMKVQGYVFCSDCGVESCCADFNGETILIQNFPDYTSLDALKAGPEKMLREAGWEIMRMSERYHFDSEKSGIEMTWWNNARELEIRAFALTEERARAEADCLAFEAMK